MSKARIALIHTTPLVLSPVEEAIRPLKEKYDFFHMLDEAILYRMMQDGNTPGLAEPWLSDLVEKCIRGGARGVIVTCSSLSPYVSAVQEKSTVPVLRIDEMMYSRILRENKNPVVLMTNPTNEVPAALMASEMKERLALKHSVPLRICPGAFAALKAGKGEEHDQAVVSEADTLLQTHDSVIFSQISMTRVRGLLPPEQQAKVFVSLDYMEQIVCEVLKG